jgi:endoglucanase
MIKKIAPVLLALFAVFSYAGPVSCYGELKASGNKLVGSNTGSDPVQVRGVSFGWSNSGWESAAFFTSNAVNQLVDQWKAEIIRAPLGIGNGGYLAANQGNANKNRVTTVVDAAIAKDVYAIIDWHSHDAHSSAETQEAINFFSEMAEKYGDKDNIIFEVYNEPLQTNWNDIKAYAEKVIAEIRKKSDNLIIVGTRFYSQYVDEPASNKINDPNVAYVLHFYAQAHTLSSFQARVNTALNANIPIFVSEYGTTHNDGGDPNKGNYNTHSAGNTDTWHNFMDQNKISSVAWNVNDKYEGSAFFGKTSGERFSQMIPGNWSNKDLMTPSGAYIYDKLNSYYNAGLPWRDCNYNTPIISSGKQLINFQETVHYYNVSGKPLGSEKPVKAGVYIARQNGMSKLISVK